jgi:hypothetical protein
VLLPNLASAACKPTWSNTSPPKQGRHSSFFDVAPVAPDDVWAVGYGSAYVGRDYSNIALIQHWDGLKWTMYPNPLSTLPVGRRFLKYTSALHGISAVSPTDVWAVGYVHGHALIEHWDGTRWSIVPNPPLPGPDVRLTDVSATSATDVWMVGSAEGHGAIALHWDGSDWDVMALPAPNPWAESILALPGGGVWATADLWALHWDGFGWTPYALAGPVSASSPSSIWIGDDHWNGSGWSDPPGDESVYRIAEATPQHGWGVGWDPSRTMHWDGTEWTIVPSNALIPIEAIAVSPQGEFWAVGVKGDTGPAASVLCPMRVTDTGFSAKSAKAAQGATVVWAFPSTNARDHGIYDASLGLFDSGARSAGASYLRRFMHAGQYTVRDAGSTYKTLINVAVGVLPAKGTAATDFKVGWAAAAAPDGHVFDVQVKRPGSTVWAPWRTAVEATGETFNADAGVGTYTFRSRMRNGLTGRATGWSQPAGISVAA